MNFHIMTLFPDMIMGGLRESITGRAMEKGLISVDTVNIRDFANNKYNHVDDYTYGGGAGMLIQAEPVYRAYEDLKEKKKLSQSARVIYMTPQGKIFNQKMAQELSVEKDIVILCGHYEGIDERALELIVTDNISIGDFVLTGGELPAMIVVDAISRLVPGVLGCDESALYESFYDGLLEYPQYTRPEDFMGMKVPPVLLSGHHKNIEEWRYGQALERTRQRRPDLFEKYITEHKDEYEKYLKRKKKLMD